MKRLSFVLFLSLCCSVLTAQTKADSIRRQITTNTKGNNVLVVSHRGEWRFAPENSIAAIEHAINIGADVVEVDIQRTKDGVLVLMHDATIDRTTNSKGLVSSICYDSLMKLSLKSGCGGRTKHKIPTLKQVLDVVKGRAMINLDKADRYFEEIYPMLLETNMLQSIIIKGTQPAQIIKERFANYDKRLIYMPIINLDKPNALIEIEELERIVDPFAYELVFSNIENENIEKAVELLTKNGKVLWFNTLWDTLAGGLDDDSALDDADGVYGKLIKKYRAGIIQSDRCEMLIKYLRNNNLR